MSRSVRTSAIGATGGRRALQGLWIDGLRSPGPALTSAGPPRVTCVSVAGVPERCVSDASQQGPLGGVPTRSRNGTVLTQSSGSLGSAVEPAYIWRGEPRRHPALRANASSHPRKRSGDPHRVDPDRESPIPNVKIPQQGGCKRDERYIPGGIVKPHRGTWNHPVGPGGASRGGKPHLTRRGAWG